jgi:chromosome segregation ATPase
MDEKDNEIQSYKNLNQKVSEELAAKREELKATKSVGQNVIEVKARLEAELMKSNDDYRQLSNQLATLQNRVDVLNDAKEGLVKTIEEKDEEIQSLEKRLHKNVKEL